MRNRGKSAFLRGLELRGTGLEEGQSVKFPVKFSIRTPIPISGKLMKFSTKIRFSASCLVLTCSGILTPLASANPRRVTEQEGMRAVVQKVSPTYPPMAKQLKLAGRVVVDMTVGENGAVENADVVNGNPILAGAAKTAAKSWRFQPFQDDGKSSKAIVRINFDFSN